MPMNLNLTSKIALSVAAAAIAIIPLQGCGGSSSLKSQTINFNTAPVLALYGTATVSATATSGLAVTYSSTTSSVCTVSSSSGLITDLAVGTCTIAADQVGNSEYAAATQVTQSIVVSAASQTIAFTAPATETYGVAPLTLSATATSGLPVTFSVLSGPGTVSGNTLTFTGSGTIMVAANQAGNENYAAAPQVTQSIVVSAGTQTITFSLGSASIKVGGTETLNASATSGLAVSYTSTTPAVCSVDSSTGLLTGLATGACSITASQAGNSSYSAATPVTASLQVIANVASYNVTAAFSDTTIFKGALTVNLETGTATGLTGSLTEAMVGPPQSAVGLPYQLSSVSDGNGGLLVSVFAENSTNVFQGGGFASSGQIYYGFPSATSPASGGWANAYATIYVNLTDPTVSIDATQLNLLSYADCTYLGLMGQYCMTGLGSGGTMGGVPLSQSITVNGTQTQTINFGTAPTISAAGGTATIAATSTSGLPIVYSSLTPQICSVTADGGVVTAISLGACTVAANQYGNGAYAAATQSTQTVLVGDATSTYLVTATWWEPDCQPDNSIFIGNFTYDSTKQTITNLSGLLTESMYNDTSYGGDYTDINVLSMPAVGLTYQLSSVSDGSGGQLVTTFAYNTTDTFKGGGFATGGTKYYGSPSATNPSQGGWGNAYATIDVNLSNPTAAVTTVQLHKIVYADCTFDGMMGSYCMTGWYSSSKGTGGGGTMGAWPYDQTIIQVGTTPQSLVFNPAPSTLAVSETTVYSFNATATASSGLDVTYSSATPQVCTVDYLTGLVVGQFAGTCTVTAHQFGDATYAPASPATISITVQ